MTQSKTFLPDLKFFSYRLILFIKSKDFLRPSPVIDLLIGYNLIAKSMLS